VSSGSRHRLPRRLLSVVVACVLVLPRGVVVAAPVSGPVEAAAAQTATPVPLDASPDQVVSADV
jgi:hypothetical protein